MKEREITEEELKTTIKEPEHIEPSVKGRMNAFKFLNGRFLRVTYKKEGDFISVVTAVKRKRPFEGENHED